MDFRKGDRVVMTKEFREKSTGPWSAPGAMVGTVTAVNDVPPEVFVEWERPNRPGVSVKTRCQPEWLEPADPTQIRTNSNLRGVFTTQRTNSIDAGGDGMVFDWSGLTTRHPAQVVTERDLCDGDIYACVRACGEHVDVIERVFVGMYRGAIEADIVDRMRANGWYTKLSFSLHADGWVGDSWDNAPAPTAVYWNGCMPSGCSHYGDMFGLRDTDAILGCARSPVHNIVVPLVWWARNPTVACATSGGRAAAHPQCPDCKGTGAIMLLTSSVPCGCTEERA